jgi:superfamily II DNA or RNA helicase
LSTGIPQDTKPASPSPPCFIRFVLNFREARLRVWVCHVHNNKIVGEGVVQASTDLFGRLYPLSVTWLPRDPRIPNGIAATTSSSRAFLRAVLKVYEPARIEYTLIFRNDRETPFHSHADEGWQAWFEGILSRWSRLARDYADAGEEGSPKSLHWIEEAIRKQMGLDVPYERLRKANVPERPPAKAPTSPPAALAPPAEPIPEVQIAWDTAPWTVQKTPRIEDNLNRWNLQELATRWWVSNQTDELLCLPHCNIERLDYQIRAALRVIGALRGRALLSDEVGLGKTIEAGLVLKEYLVRGMVRKFLILTQPSLVDQWAEELAAKFNITVATTHESACRTNPAEFWQNSHAVVASLPLVRQPGQRPHVQAVPWDMLIVDEAHHLRNRTSVSWDTVSSLPRKFLLLLTATPVQNSLEELYNLVTLLQPGQLASPKEFRARFMDPKKPRQPKEPEELRRLLGQVMIRNTRANSGIQLPPRRAETAQFEPDPAEAQALVAWEAELRESLSTLSASLASLWGRLLLQTAGSSPAALQSALASYPDRVRAKEWSQRLVLPDAWKRKCALLPPIAAGQGGVVVFTQFLATQQALADALTQAGVPNILMNGSTPAAQRQPMIEQFRQRGGALLLTQSGTEGRNLQFCHRMVNFDLPWNPMEIEQRIGRLHRLGQKHPVRIYNFVQAGTLQEQLLHLLQEKLNLFELVVGETGLVLGDRFGEDDFADEILRRWRESQGRLDEAFTDFGNELARARDDYRQVQELDATLFAQDYANL